MAGQLVAIQAFDASGNPVPGAKFRTRAAGTTTLKAAYADEAGTVALSNPVVTNAAGIAACWLKSGIGDYKIDLLTPDEATFLFRTIDNYSPDTDSILYIIGSDIETARTEALDAATAAQLAQSLAETAETNAELAEQNAENAQTAAESAQAAAAASATTATTQAGIATTQAGIATTQAGIATTQAGLAATARTGAETAQALSEDARDDTAAWTNAAVDAPVEGVTGEKFVFNPQTDLNTTTNVITKVAHGLVNDQPVTYRNGGGTAPAGLVHNTQYWAEFVTVDTFKLKAARFGATAIDITTTGTGTAHEIFFLRSAKHQQAYAQTDRIAAEAAAVEAIERVADIEKFVLGSFANDAAAWADPNAVANQSIYHSTTDGFWRVLGVAAPETFILAQFNAATLAASAFSQSTTYSAGTIGKKLQQAVNPMDAPYNAVGDGTANDYAAFIAADAAAAAAGLPLRITKTHRLDTSYTPTADLVFDGGKIKPANLTTFTVNKAVFAPCVRIFDISLGGVVNLNDAKIPHGYFEWFGVIPDSSGAAADNAAWMNAALVATPKIVATAADYFHGGVIKILTPNHELHGAGSLYDATYGVNATRLIGTDGSIHVLQIGPDANPGGIAVLPQGIKVSGIQVTRSVAPVVASACTAVRVRYVFGALINDVRGDESMNGWEFDGTVATTVHDCWAKRTSAGTGGADSWKGFYVNGGSGIAAGGNASLRIVRSHADDTRAVKTNSTGFIADQKFTDCFWIDCETSECTVGMEVAGNDSLTNDSGNTDMTIIHPVNDAFAVYGIYIHNMGLSGSVEISAPYCGPASGATSAIQIGDNKGGTVTITGGQLVMSAAAACKGITIDALGDKSGGGSIVGTLISETGTNGAVVMADAKNWRIEPVIQNDSVTGGPAVQLINACTANYIAPIVKGKDNAFTLGIQVVGTTDDSNEYACTGIDSSAISGGVANKLVRNGVQITTAYRLTGTNVASGVMSSIGGSGFSVDTLAALSALNGSQFSHGDIITMKGYDTSSDGAGGTFIVDKTNNVGGAFGHATSITAGSGYTVNGGAAGGFVQSVGIAGSGGGSGGLCDVYFFEGAVVDAVVSNPGSGYSGTITANITTAHANIDTGTGGAVTFSQNDLGTAVNAADGTAVFRRHREGENKVNAKWFGVKTGNTPATNRSRLQAALDAAQRDNLQFVHVTSAPGSQYQIDATLYSHGVGLSGDGRQSFGVGETTVSVIEMTAAGNTDIWRPRSTLASAIYRAQFVRFQDITLRHEKTATTGHAINLIPKGATRTDETKAVIIDGDLRIINVTFRWTPENGVNLKRGISAPGIIDGVLSEFVGGYGVDVRVQNTSRVLSIQNCGFDGNQGGAGIRINIEASSNGVNILNCAAEARSDSSIRGVTAGGYTYAGPALVDVVASNQAAYVNIIGSAYSNGHADALSTALVRVTGSVSANIPEITIVGGRASFTADASYNGLIHDAINSIKIRANQNGSATYNVDRPQLSAPGGPLSVGSNLYLTLAQDTAASFAPPSGVVHGVYLISDGVTQIAITNLKVGSGNLTEIIHQSSGNVYTATTGVLTGTTGAPGTDGKNTISTHTDGLIYIQQRATTSRTFRITPLQLDYGN